MTLRHRLCVALALASAIGATSIAQAATELANEQYRVRAEADGTLIVTRADGAVARFAPKFAVLSSERNPSPALRWGRFDRAEEMFYNVMTWDRGGPTTQSVASDTAAAAATTQHVEDGYDPKSDRGVDANRTPSLFRAGVVSEATATDAIVGDDVQWRFAESADYAIDARVSVPAGAGEPVLKVTLKPKTGKFYSVGYVGAPAVDYAAVEDLFQPLIWTERRWPSTSVLTESFRAPVPTCFVTSGGVTTGVVADPKELPFQPLPTLANSAFGVALRDADGRARPMLFAPILGHVNSKMAAGDEFSFTMRLFVSKGDTISAFEQVARGLFGLRDLRRNGPITLNKTFENTVDFAMSPHAHFNEQLRGSAYETDVPGAVKNVTALHPFGVALATDNAEVFERRARPMIEFSMSRERFLFAIDPKIKGQGVSTKLTGPGVPLTDVAALYDLSGRKSPILLKLAEGLYPRTRILNLESESHGDAWYNDVALYKATGDKAWLEKAVTKADAYIASRVETPAADFHDRDSRGMFFWTSYAPNFVELFDLYEITKEPRHLAAAHRSARRYAQFMWACPTVPEGDVTVNENGIAPLYRNNPQRFKSIPAAPETVPAWRVSEIGLTSESSGTSKGHRAIFLASPAPYLLRIAQAAGDTFLHDLARSAIVGRSASFPGYHINTARNTAYEKADFAERPLAELNSTTSLHYNHIWPHVAMLLDYLVSDAATRSKGAIDFPSEYAEGYAYMQGKVYGGAPGRWYDEQGVALWMPKGLVDVGHGELNYVSGRGNGKVYVALTNQSDEPIETTIRLNADLLPAGSRGKTVRIWQDNNSPSEVAVDGLSVPVAVSAKGITAIAIDGIEVAPKFQHRVGNGKAWTTDSATLPVGEATAMILNFGPTLTNAYVHCKADGTVFKSVKLRYRLADEEKTLDDDAFPFEWSIAVPESANEFAWQIEATGVDGSVQTSERSTLRR